MSPRAAAFLLLLLPMPAAVAQGLTLVQDGRAKAVIVVPRTQLKGAQRSAAEVANGKLTGALALAELREHLEKITGAQISVVGEDAAAALDASLPVRIYLGDCAANRALIGDRPLRPEEMLIRSGDNALHLFGGDKTAQGQPASGTLYAVYDLLERDCGVRWLFPGDAGTVIPRQRTLTLPRLDRREQPTVAKRKVRNVAVSRDGTFASLLSKWDISMDDWKAAQGSPSVDLWFRRQRLGSRIEIEGGHAFADWFNKYGKDHPDFFALQPHGSRMQVPSRERLCKSNPALWDFIAKDRIAQLKADPAQATISICPNDGGKNVFCMCNACRALDPPEAPKILSNSQLIDPATKKPFPEYPSLSDRVFTFYNEIARRVRAELPDRYLVGYAYSVYRTPPVRIQKLEPNLIIGYVGLDLSAIDAWSRLAAQMYIRPNDLGPMVELGMPRNNAPYLAKAVKFAVDHHAIGFDFDNCHGNWSCHGLDYYVLCKMLWNPNADARELIADYCRAAYGPGAEAMLRYHGRLEKISDAIRADGTITSRSANAPKLVQFYSADALAELEKEITAAKGAIADTDPAALARVTLAEDGLRYARLLTPLLAVTRKPPALPAPEYAPRLAAVETLLKEKAVTPALASLHSYRYLRIALNYAQREED